jgi:hypothetical protein
MHRDAGWQWQQRRLAGQLGGFTKILGSPFFNKTPTLDRDY